jgi:hypothetical protein
MGDDQVSPDGRWEVRWVITKDFNSYFESDTRYEVRVINRATQKCLVSFVRSEFGNADGSRDSGLSDLEFLPDGVTLRATHENGTVEDVTLPSKDH